MSRYSHRQDTFKLVLFTYPELYVSAGSQKRTIHEPEGRDESRSALKLKRNLDVTIAKHILSLFGQIVSLFGQTNYLGLRTLCPKRLPDTQVVLRKMNRGKAAHVKLDTLNCYTSEVVETNLIPNANLLTLEIYHHVNNSRRQSVVLGISSLCKIDTHHGRLFTYLYFDLVYLNCLKYYY